MRATEKAGVTQVFTVDGEGYGGYRGGWRAQSGRKSLHDRNPEFDYVSEYAANFDSLC